MKLEGLILNTDISTYPPNSWSFAKNVIVSKDGQSILNERGFDDNINPLMTIIGNITIGNTNIIFSGNQVDSEIGTLVDNTYTVILKEPLLAFNLQYPILGVATFNHKGEIIVAFTDDYNTPKVLNLTTLPFISGLDVNHSLVNKSEFSLCELFPSVKNPKFNNILVKDSGGSLVSGVNYLSLRYVFNDGSTTTWQDISNPITITDDSMATIGSTYSEYDGCEANTPTSKMIEVTLENLDTNFTKFQLAIISKVNGVLTGCSGNDISYTGSTKITNISNLSLFAPLSISDILTLNPIYTRARAITLISNRLYLANVKGIPIIDYQEYANAINISWCRTNAVSLETIEGSYKDSTVLFDKKGFKSGEVYALYIGLRLKQGGYYGVWTIPGRETVAGTYDERNVLTSAPYVSIANSPKHFQFIDGSTDESGGLGLYGKMSYWENANELYPTEFPTYGGTPVRHHKFPTLAALEHYNEKFIKTFVPTPGATELVYPLMPFTYPYGSGRIVHFSNVSGTPYGTFDSTNTILTCTEPQQITISQGIILTKLIGGSTDVYINIKKVHLGVSTIVYSSINNLDTTSPITVNLACGPITLEAEDLLTLSIYSIFGNFSVTYNGLQYSCTQIDISSFTGKVTYPLGLKISNVNIPEALSPYVDGWEIFYAERTVDNMTVVAQDVLFDTDWVVHSFNYNTFRIHAFDLMHNRLGITPTHLDRQLDFTVSELNPPTSPSVSDYITYVYTDTTALTDEEKILQVKSLGYYPAKLNGVLYDNSLNEDALILQLVPDTDTVLNSANHRFLADICSYKTDVYLNYNNQNLVSTGIFNNISTFGIQPTSILYGGDTITSRYAYQMYRTDGAVRYLTPYIIAEGISNANLRHIGTSPEQIYYPKSDLYTDLITTEYMDSGNYWGYNNDYNSVNNNIQPIIDYPNINLTNTFLNRIIRSLSIQTESVSLNWRTFSNEDYYEMTTNKGYINKLTSLDTKTLYIAHQYALFVASVKDTIDAISGSLAIKEGDLFDRTPIELVPSEYGYIGSNSRFGAFICKYGYFHVDVIRGKVYLISDSVDEISNKNTSEFFKLGFLPTIIDTVQQTDNPYTGVGVSAIYDDINDRILITSNARIYNDGEYTVVPDVLELGLNANTLSIANKSYTISYNCKQQFWVGFHDYLCNGYINERKGILGIVNDSSGGTESFVSHIYKLNSDSKYSKYPTAVVPSYIDFVFDNGQSPDTLLENIAYDCEIKSSTVTYWDKTLSNAMIRTKQQCSGEIDLVIKTWSNQLTTGNVKNVKGLWILNAFKDLSVDTNVAFIDIEGELVNEIIEGQAVNTIQLGRQYVVDGVNSVNDYITYNAPGSPAVLVYYTYNGQPITPISGVTTFVKHGTAIVKNYKKWSEKSNIITKFAVVRLKYDNSEQLIMKLNNISLNVK
jgi:hypothetical protein